MAAPKPEDITDELLTRYERLFVRTRWPYIHKKINAKPWKTVGKRNDSKHSKPPLSSEQVREHLTHQHFYGILLPHNTEQIIIDLDDHRDIGINKKLPGLKMRVKRLRELKIPCSFLVRSSQGGSIHWYIHLNRLMTSQLLRDCLTDILEAGGLSAKRGDFELLPEEWRGLRLPFGKGSYRVKCDTLRPIREPLQDAIDWIEREAPTFDIDTFLPLRPIKAKAIAVSKNAVAPSRDEVDANLVPPARVQGEFMQEVTGLLQVGLTKPSSRFESTKKLVWYFWSRGLEEAATRATIRQWLATKTNGLSKDWLNDRAYVLRELDSLIRRTWEYTKQQGMTPYGLHGSRSTTLSKEEVDLLVKMIVNNSDKIGSLLHAAERIQLGRKSVPRRVLNSVERCYKNALRFMYDILVLAKRQPHKIDCLPLARELITKLDGVSIRTYQRYVQFAKDIGLLRLAKRHSRKSRRCRRYEVCFPFTGQGDECSKEDALQELQGRRRDS